MTVPDPAGRVVAVDSDGLVAQARAVLTLAFADDPVTRWLYPRATDLLERFPRLIDGFGVHGFAHGSARITSDGSGVAVWLPPGVDVDEPTMAAVLEHDVAESVRSEAADFFAAMDAHHPTGEHWFLPMLGVEPGSRDAGRGGALLTEGLARCDAEHLDAYLESTNPRNIPLYRRHGFETVGTIQVGTSPVMTPMLRPAR